MRARTMSGLLLVVMGTTSCIPLWGGRVYASKLVIEKHGANLLVASDRSTCTVSDSVFSSVSTNTAHRCVWEPSDPSETRIRPGTFPTPRRPREISRGCVEVAGAAAADRCD